MANDIWSLLENAASRRPDRVAVTDGSRRFTYAGVRDASAGFAAVFRERGLEPGDRVAILEENSLTFLAAYFGAACAGVILVPINYRLAPRELAFVLQDSGARLLLAARAFEEPVAKALAEGPPVEGVRWLDSALPSAPEARPAPVKPEDVAHLYYTSGTTGRPKGVMLTHRNVCVHARNAVEELKIGEHDVWGHFAPMFHLADAWATFAVTMAGGRHVMVPRFEEEMVLAAIARDGVTISNLIPTMLNRMVKHPGVAEFDLRTLRAILSGGAPIAPELVRSVMEAFGCDYVQTYGMTETSPYLTLSLLPDHLRDLPLKEQFRLKARTGRPFLGVDLEVVDEAGVPVPHDDETVGEIRVRGETVTPGYWRRPEETREAFEAGWLKTGDLAVVDGEGFVNIVDRRKDMIICGGENVYSIEVENVLYEHPKVLEAAVIGVPDETWGEAVLAAVVLRDGESATSQEIRSFCRERLAGYKTPKRIEFLAQLPRTGSGKLSKAPLRERFGGRTAP